QRSSAPRPTTSEVIARMLPPWQTTAARRPSAAARMRSNAATERRWSSRYVSPSGYPITPPSRQIRNQSGSRASTSSLEQPTSPPTSTSRRAGSITASSPVAVEAATGLEAVIDPALREVDVGGLVGCSREEVEARDPEWFRIWRDGGVIGYPDGETYLELH